MSEENPKESRPNPRSDSEEAGDGEGYDSALKPLLWLLVPFLLLILYGVMN